MLRIITGVILVVNVAIASYFIVRIVSPGKQESPVEFTGHVGVHHETITPNEQLTKDNTAFGMDLYAAFSENDGNLFFSPYSISEAFAMLYAGARGETADEMAEVLHLTLDPDYPNGSYRMMAVGFDMKINMPRDKYVGDDKFRLNIANGFWTQEGFPINEEYAGILRDCYQSEPASLDFVHDAVGSRRIINTWISDKTEGMIKDILSPNALSAETQLVLANTIYFEAKWDKPFYTTTTTEGEFHRLDNTTVTVPIMRTVLSAAYTKGTDWQAAQLEYSDCNMAMLFILPREGHFPEIESLFDDDFLAALDETMTKANLQIRLPRFTFTSPTLDLKETLIQLGMESVFGFNADLSGISSQPLILAGAYHKASVTVDEEGTIASAATVLASMKGEMTLKPIEFTADRPFIFLIRDLDTKAVLFMGRVLDPTEQ